MGNRLKQKTFSVLMSNRQDSHSEDFPCSGGRTSFQIAFGVDQSCDLRHGLGGGRNGEAFQYSQPLIIRKQLEEFTQKSRHQLEKAILSEVQAGLRIRVSAEGRAWMDRGKCDGSEQNG